ncbi:MAG: DUF4259 domain-containing protein [Planctomycetes bacterium]|nr:DUF4259 domain-containing protein [Planctomycetota bacterium]
MIAWGPGSFQNEEGNDWIDELVESQDLSSIVLALQSIVEFAGTEDLEAQDCACAIVACEVVATAGGNPAKDLPKKLRKFIEEMAIGVTAPVQSLAAKTLEKVKQTPAMLRQFKEAGTLDEWLDNIEGLERRIAEAAIA